MQVLVRMFSNKLVILKWYQTFSYCLSITIISQFKIPYSSHVNEFDEPLTLVGTFKRFETRRNGWNLKARFSLI